MIDLPLLDRSFGCFNSGACCHSALLRLTTVKKSKQMQKYIEYYVLTDL